MKKIMFNDRLFLTQAVLEGRKTQTRRFINPQPILTEHSGSEWKGSLYGLGFNQKETYKNFLGNIKTPYKVGEVVAIAQRYSHVYSELLFDWAKHNYHLVRKMSAEKFREKYEHHKGWENKMFVKPELMPHQIRITKVRLQRLQEITDDECLLEGIQRASIGFYVYGLKVRNHEREAHRETENGCMKLFPTAREAYAKLIDALSGQGTWKRNPYVFAYDFELVR